MSRHHHKPSWMDATRWAAPDDADPANAPATAPTDAPATAPTDADPLAGMPFFASLRPADRRALGACGTLRSYAAGATLVEEGQRPDVGLFIVMRGSVRITQLSVSDGVRPLALLGPGEMFGELALLDGEPRSATAMAITPTLAFVTPIFDIRPLLRRNPEIAIALLGQMSRRIRAAEAWLTLP
ncbi:MAG: cyclic nucleotide-binding domain-containing protein [Chloroflexota bacterium]|nr:cyclic nucleotide-binding domain-containing protein [Chloroflexota bacterium]